MAAGESTTTHESFREFRDAAPPSERSFGLLVGGILAVIAVWPWIRHAAAPIRYWLLAPALILMLLGLVRPVWLRLPNRLWMRFALLISRVTNPIVTALLFFLVFTPFAVVLRMLGKDPLRRAFDPQASTYWIARETGPEPSGMGRQF